MYSLVVVQRDKPTDGRVEASIAQRVRPRVAAGGQGGSSPDMSAAEQAERIRGAGSQRTGLVIFVLEKALEAAGVAAVTGLAGNLPGSRTNALTSQVVIACRLIDSSERSPRGPRKVTSGFARRVGKSAPLEVREDQFTVGVPRSLFTDGGPCICFGLDSLG